MVIRDIQNIIETWAPTQIAWERDSIGLQVGSPLKRINRILVTLDLTDEIIKEAKRKKIDLIVTHHPILYQPIKTINMNERTGRLLMSLVQSDIALFSAHTNLDFTQDGVSITLAKQIGLQNVDFLLHNYQLQKKIVVYVPIDYVDRMIKEMSEAGAGVIGKYASCSFSTKGIGTFKPLKGAKPYIGKLEQLEKVDEMKLEMVLPTWELSNVVAVMKRVHPYEEIAYDVYDLKNVDTDFGTGAIGDLPSKIKLKDFLRHLKKTLKIPICRYNGNLMGTIKRVAVCGGSGSELIEAAVQKGASAFITADISYHRFSECDNRLALIDAGHFETEFPVVKIIADHLKAELKKKNSYIKVFTSNISTNYVHYFIP